MVLCILLVWFVGSILSAYFIGRFKLKDGIGGDDAALLALFWPAVLMFTIILSPFILFGFLYDYLHDLGRSHANKNGKH